MAVMSRGTLISILFGWVLPVLFRIAEMIGLSKPSTRQTRNRTLVVN